MNLRPLRPEPLLSHRENSVKPRTKRTLSRVAIVSIPLTNSREISSRFEDCGRSVVVTLRSEQQTCEPILLSVGSMFVVGSDRVLTSTPRHGQRCLAVAAVVSLNLHRRHLTESQRSMVASKIATLKKHDNQHTKEDRSPDRGGACKVLPGRFVCVLVAKGARFASTGNF